MACEITSGYDKDCDSAGGVNKWYAINVDNFTYTKTAGEVTAITNAASKQWYAFNVEIETSMFTDTAIGERANGSYAREQSATIVFHGNTKEDVVLLDTIAKGRIALIACLEDGSYELLFADNGGKMIDERASGTAYDELNGNTLTFTGRETSKAPKVDSTLIAALTTPGTT